MKLATGLFLLMIFTTRSHAVRKEDQSKSGCGEERQDIQLDSAGHSMHHIPTKNQIFDICYAHTAADMVDAIIHQKNPEQTNWTTSPMATAILSTLKKRRKEYSTVFEWGTICRAAEALNENVLYSRSDVEGLLFKSIAENHNIEDRHQKKAKKDGKNYFEQIFNFIKAIKKGEEKQNDQLQCLIGKNQSSDRLTSRWQGLLERVNELNYLNILKEIYLNKADQRPTPAITCSGMQVNKLRQRKALRRIHEELDKDQFALPIGIDICEEVLEYAKITRKKNCNRHALSIIGRRSNEKTGRCQFLLKNTNPCNEHHKMFRKECKDNKIWIDSKMLIKSTHGIYFVHPKESTD